MSNYCILSMHLNSTHQNHGDVRLSSHSQCIHIQGKESPQRNTLSGAPVPKDTCILAKQKKINHKSPSTTSTELP